jgi:hypothetical protein
MHTNVPKMLMTLGFFFSSAMHVSVSRR